MLNFLSELRLAGLETIWKMLNPFISPAVLYINVGELNNEIFCAHKLLLVKIDVEIKNINTIDEWFNLEENGFTNFIF